MGVENDCRLNKLSSYATTNGLLHLGGEHRFQHRVDLSLQGISVLLTRLDAQPVETLEMSEHALTVLICQVRPGWQLVHCWFRDRFEVWGQEHLIRESD